ncbi:MAG: hypothetical protein WBV94_12830 [Blastocatellia bacterium]
MRKVITFLAALAITLGLVVVASAHDRHRFGQRNRVRVVRTYPVRSVRVVRLHRPVRRVLGVRYYSPYNYGHRRSVFVRNRNFQRRAWRRHWIRERRHQHRYFIHH